MAQEEQSPGVVHRQIMAALGGVAGLALWVLSDQWGAPQLPVALFLALFVFITTCSGVTLALAGPVAVLRAFRGGLVSALVLTVLISLAGMRHTVATDVLDDPVTLAVAGVLVLLSTPFLLVWMQNPRETLQYASLFDAAWMLTVRYGVAWVFVATFWLVIMLSGVLLELVDIGIVNFLLSTEWVPSSLSGAVLGLGLAVVHEQRRTISPYLLLRLMRLLVPLVLVVVGVFLLAVPVRGLNHLFGEFSAAGTLMGAAVVGITLISTALDRDDTAAVRTRGLRLATQALAVLLPLLIALAVWAVVLRVRQYGWTPDRILGMTVSVLLLAYGLAYCGAVVLRCDWMGRIRHVNVGMALVLMAVSLLWMTPVLNVYQISSASQIARYESGQIPQDQLALWPLAHEWGRAGQTGLARLEADAVETGNTALQERIVAARTEKNRYLFEQGSQTRAVPERVAELLSLMPVLPKGATVNPDLLSELPSYAFDMWMRGCQQKTGDDRPGCVLVQGGFVPSFEPEEQAMVLYLDEKGQTRINHVVLGASDGFIMRDVFDPATRAWPSLPDTTIPDVQDGGFDIRPSGINALSLGGKLFAPAQ